MEPVLLEKDLALVEDWERGVGKGEWVVMEWGVEEIVYVPVVGLKFHIK
jgi:hypothetical protein